MKTHLLHCQNPWFSFIKSGQKRVEGRKALPRFTSFQIGDALIFHCDKDQFSTTIVAIRRYATLDAYLLTEGIENVLPGITSLDDARAIYLQWSTPDEIARYGFLAIEVALKQ